jgi:hypothetical protein
LVVPRGCLGNSRADVLIAVMHRTDSSAFTPYLPMLKFPVASPFQRIGIRGA